MNKNISDPHQTSDLPEPTLDLNIFDLSVQVRDRVLLQQKPNNFLQTSELILFVPPKDNEYFDKDYYQDNNDTALCYFQVGTKYLVLING